MKRPSRVQDLRFHTVNVRFNIYSPYIISEVQSDSISYNFVVYPAGVSIEVGQIQFEEINGQTSRRLMNYL